MYMTPLFTCEVVYVLLLVLFEV